MADKDIPATGFENNQSKSNGRGGRRTGAGRKPGAVTSRSRKFADEAVASGDLLPLDFMLVAMRDDAQPFDVRMDAAKAAAPYIHAKLAAVSVGGEDGGSIQIMQKVILEGVSPP